MSEYGDTGHYDQGDERYDLDHGHQVHSYDENHDANYDAYAEAHNHKFDLDYDNGKAFEYDAPDGTHVAEQEFTHLDVHESDSSAVAAQHYDQQDSYKQYLEEDYFKEHYLKEFEHADYLDSGEGHAAIAAK